MKTLILALSAFISFQALAGTISSSKKSINVARIDKVVTLVEKADIKVNVVVEDLGGSTDVSPTQNLYFTLYSKGEMFSTDATFDLGPIFSLVSAKRVDGGVYEIKAVVPTEDGAMKTKVLKVNAVKAITSIKSVNCGGDFDCEASSNFASEIIVK